VRKVLLAFTFLLASAISAFGQSTTVSGTVTDAGSQAWTNGTYKFLFVPNPQFPTGPYTWTGGTLNFVISGSLDGSGNYSVAVPSSSAITPAGSKWILQVTPNATSPSFSTVATTITGGTQTLNATPPAILISWSLPPGPAISAYADGEIGGTLVPGSEYFNTTSLLTRVWSGSAWANQGAGAGGSCPPGGATNGELLYDNAGSCAGALGITTDGLANLTLEGILYTSEVESTQALGGNLAVTCDASVTPCAVQFGTNGQNVTSEITGSLLAVTTSTGTTFGSPTGGAEGAGTINAQGLYVSGVAVGRPIPTNWVLVNIAKTDAGATGTSSLAAPAASHTAGNLLVTCVASFLSGSPTAATTPTNTAADTWTLATSSRAQSSSGGDTECWWTVTAGNASDVVTAHWGTTITYPGIVVLQYSGNKPSGTVFDFGNNAHCSSVSTCSVTASTPALGDLIVAVVNNTGGGAGTYTAQSGYLFQGFSGTNSALFTEVQPGALNVSQTPGFVNAASSNYLVSVAAFKTNSFTSN
jgi:hypothetical protein